MNDTAVDQDNVKPIPPEFPPVVYLPCAAHASDPSEAVVELRRTRDGRMALMAYSALDRLKYCCGDQQPWMVVPTAQLDNIQQVQPFELVLLDVIIPPEHRHGAEGASDA
ncbi:SAV_915 family protein [Amycolatopsis aidingensis]|uniref:SAV_915 family protein n=1 Tax=Amycolatopsis aidingensis TaxID=2842453 RepID=UPI001E533188|nr:SAV_915 family protein [Amycolatopsis aidingensis]